MEWGFLPHAMRDLAFNFFHRDIWKQELQLQEGAGFHVCYARFEWGTEWESGKQDFSSYVT